MSHFVVTFKNPNKKEHIHFVKTNFVLLHSLEESSVYGYEASITPKH